MYRFTFNHLNHDFRVRIYSTPPLAGYLAAACTLQALLSDGSTTRVGGKQHLRAMQFAEEVLGFEDYRQPHNMTGSNGESFASGSFVGGAGGVRA